MKKKLGEPSFEHALHCHITSFQCCYVDLENCYGCWCWLMFVELWNRCRLDTTWWWKRGFCLFIALMLHLFHLSQSNHVCRMRAALSTPSSIARLYHFLSISSPDEYHSPPPILLSFLFTLCHFCTTLSLLLNLQSRQAALSAPLSLLKQFTLGYLQMHACMRCHEQTLGERLSVHVSRKIER